jgi:NAD(P)-dependent dehydrogenase (short-subunit alcohol dehydrogenase family)
MTHPALQPGNAAVVTGAASGIGLAAAHRLAALGLNIMLSDRPGAALERAKEDVAARASNGAQIHAFAADVADPAQLVALREAAFERFGGVSVLMNNAAIGSNPGKPWEAPDAWRALMEINLWGVINGVQAFTGAMLQAGKPGLIINTGSKQGITLPPGNSAYNVSKAGVRAFTELLAHELREAGGRISAHLLIPGFTHTGMTGSEEKPKAAWTADQVVEFMLQSLARGDFYILCPDNDVSRATDERRMRWAMGDIIENRPALSRWHPDYKEAFAAFMQSE